MKKIIILTIALVASVGAFGQRPQSAQSPQQPAASQASQPQRQTVVFLTTLTCDNCRQRIEGSIPYQRGVSDVVVDVPSKRVTVTFDPQRSDTTRLIAAFKKLGYQAKVIEQRP